jgi:hypothetical protein
MIIGGLVELAFGINAEGKSLEHVAAPLAEVGAERRAGCGLAGPGRPRPRAEG